MARRKLNFVDQLKGVNAALRSPRTPPQLKEGLRKRAEDLQRKLGQGGKRSRGRRKGSDLLSMLGIG